MPRRDSPYGGKWPAARAGYLRKHPWCVVCQQLGQLVRATDVDHIVRWRDHPGGFWDTSNWRGCCSLHHKSKSGRETHGMTERMGCGADGIPSDPAHPWHRPPVKGTALRPWTFLAVCHTPTQKGDTDMPSQQPNTRRIEELQRQIEQAKNEGRDTAQMQAELDQLQGQSQSSSGEKQSR